MNNSVLSNLDHYVDKFKNNKPFKYVEINNFLKDDILKDLVKDFPEFDVNSAKDEFGNKSKKHVVTDIYNISNNYKKFYDYISSNEFLGIISKITNIEDLIFDHTMFGGGTHNNLHGQKLDVHVDFNYDNFGNHRRLNLLLYLNEGWEESWGGNLELHSNPRDIDNDEIKKIIPTLNNCAIFETNEYSWHGFEKINLPIDKVNQNISRKCISIYLYTKTRPKEEIFGRHGTYYVQYPAKQIQVDQIITPQIYKYITNHISERDDWIKLYQKTDLELRSKIKTLEKYLIKQIGAFEITKIDGQLNGNWLSENCNISIKTYKDIKSLKLHFYLPKKFLHFNNTNYIYVNDNLIGVNEQNNESQSLDIDVNIPRDTIFTINITSKNIIKISETEIYGCLLASISENNETN